VRSIEESLRGAFREVADEVPAESVPPLILPARRRSWLSREAVPPAAGRARAWAAVASSAVMVAVVLGAAASLGSVLHRHQAGGAETAYGPEAPAAPVTAARGVPRYYVALTVATALGRAKTRSRASAVVRATATGATIATVAPPQPFDTFTMVTAARDDRTFVLAAERFPPAPQVRLFVLRIHPSRRAPARRAQLDALPVPYLEKGARAWGLALSPNGRQLAVASGIDSPQQLQVVDLASGSQHSWGGTSLCAGCAVTGLSASSGWISWTTDEQTLAFAGAGSVRVLNVAKSGADLMADSRPVSDVLAKTWPAWRDVVLTPDEQALVAVREVKTGPRPGHAAAASQELVRMSTVTGQPMAVLNYLPVRQGSYEQVLWTSTSGRVVIVSGTEPGASAGILRDRHYTPIPWTPGVLTAAW